jgi:hypothetical protein
MAVGVSANLFKWNINVSVEMWSGNFLVNAQADARSGGGEPLGGN